MTEKLPALVMYAAAGLALALWPLAMSRSAAGAALPPARDGAMLAALKVAGATAGLLVSTVLPWWRHAGGFAVSLSWAEAGVFAVIAALVLSVLLPAPGARSGSRATGVGLAGAFVLAAAALSFSTLTYHGGDGLVEAWHHWGAYIGPSELLLAGAHIFDDFPAQYGLGPTAVIAFLCRSSCWATTYYVVSTASWAFALVIALLAVRAAAPRKFAQRAMVLLLCLGCCFFWLAYPPMLASPATYPSVGGMRFLPAAAVAALLLFADREGQDFFLPAGHAAWAAAALWSIESAFYVTCVWWPTYLMLLRARSAGRPGATLLRGVATLALLSAAWTGCFLLAYWLAYRSTPTWLGFFVYVLNPPGEMPIGYGGALWFFIATIGLGAWVNWRSFRQAGNTRDSRQGLVLLLLAYFTFSYFLGRSHDNNVLNLLPFMLLVLLYAWARSEGFAHALAAGLLASLLGWLAVFNWSNWQAGVHSPARSWLDPHWARAAVPGAQRGPNGFAPETAQVIERARQLMPDPVIVVGPLVDLATTDAAAWSALHSPANLYLLAPQVRREFLRKTALRLQLGGWLLLQIRQPIAMGLLPDFDAVYTRTQSFEMLGYLAVHYAVRKP